MTLCRAVVRGTAVVSDRYTLTPIPPIVYINRINLVRSICIYRVASIRICLHVCV